MTQDQWVTIPQAAAIIGKSPEMMHYYIKSGRGPQTETHAGYELIHIRELANWMPKKKQQGRPKGTTQ